jgi:signal peptide peptidase SppA
MKYLHILLACANEPWLLQREKLAAVTQFLLFKAKGGSFSAQELAARLDGRRERAVARRAGAVAVIPVHGVISQRMNLMDEISGGTSVEQLTSQFRELVADNDVKAIVMEFDTPGGAASGVPELASEILASRGGKPIIAQINSLACSAGYWLASAADEIVVSPSASAGAIGVYTIHEDISETLKNEGIKETLIYSGKYKVEGNEFEPLSDEGRQFFQTRVDEIHSEFIDAVAAGRGVSADVVSEEYGQGRYFRARELMRRGMVDRIGTLDDTLERFGVQMRPQVQRENARADRLKMKLLAGVQPTTRELEDGLKGFLGLSNSEAERAVKLLAKGEPHGDREPGKVPEQTDHAAVQRELAEIRRTLDRFTIPKL